ncbi:hypothetical protein KLP40_12280 [Hymenobacter sp. NST-14]|uniref:hypothetical protein n=1 Tax=Hymenobacter piscis TaxID=2839984 RepID=UPI001C01AC68|nr:hypothetical protein [Hymenobacter piscis]MBT9393942.1 hypothetical protein [Hymenobacter piscis]
MELKDLFLTPLYLGLFYGLAFALRKRFTNPLTRKYFIPALSVKFLGAISLGLIYQFYYSGGDTFNYYNHTKVVYEALTTSSSTGIKILTAQPALDADMLKYSQQMVWYNSPTEYFVVQVASFFSILCFNTYTVIGLFFACLSFCGMWAMYTTFIRIYPLAYRKFAFAIFFLPSVFFWGSGLMKDSLCMGALGWAFYGFYHGLVIRKNIVTAIFLGTAGAFIIASVKVYILLSFIGPCMLWIFIENNNKIKSKFLRISLLPIFITAGLGAAYVGVTNITAGDAEYDLENIAERSRINQDYLMRRAVTRQGSLYDIGKLDGSIGSIVKVAPQAVVVTIFRPFLFEARNPIMLLSAMEASLFLFLTIKLFYKSGFLKSIKLIASEPILTFCFIFSIIFSIGVGVNSGNFGTLVRYKIPMMPFYLSALYIMQYRADSTTRSKKRKQLALR